MSISIIGCGYVGLVTGACLASLGETVTCVDIDDEKINNLKDGKIPIFEPELEFIVKRSLKVHALNFTNNIEEAVRKSELVFIAVNTPTNDDFSVDLNPLLNVLESIVKSIDKYKVIIIKSTVPVGTCKKLYNTAKTTLRNLGKSVDFDIISNPEFLREGSAVKDFLYPERIIIGSENRKATAVIKTLYNKDIYSKVPLLITDTTSAEMIKYASNSFLATKVSFINEMSNICELCGADIEVVAKGMGYDSRIGEKFLRPGPGFGGSCFPKDTKALFGLVKKHGYHADLINSVILVNEKQKENMFSKVKEVLGQLEGKVVTILGISYKAGTDDIRESPALWLIKKLILNNVLLKVFDPKALDNLKCIIADEIIFCDNAYEACEYSDCIIVHTEWDEFKKLDFDYIGKKANEKIIIDLKNIYNPATLITKGFRYIGTGRNVITNLNVEKAIDDNKDKLISFN